jgi:hypothetical protein
MHFVRSWPLLAVAALMLAGCGTSGPFGPLGGGPSPDPVAPAMAPEIPSTIQPAEIVGRYGLAAYHREVDRVRTEKAARAQCGQPYVIGMGQSGGVIMHLADQAQPTELRLKGSQSGKNYIGPAGEPAGSPSDREIVSFDGRVLITRFVDPDALSRYGTMVYVRCGPRA